MDKNKDKKNKKKLIVILLLLLLIVLILIIWGILKKEKPEAVPQEDPPKIEVEIDDPDDEKEDTDQTDTETTDEEQTDQTPVVDEGKKEESTTTESPSSGSTTSQPSTDTEVEKPADVPSKTDPLQAVPIALNSLSGLKGSSRQTGSIANPSVLTIEVSDTETPDNAAAQIVDAIKSKLGYNEATADGTVPVGNPNPFSYDYNLSYASSADGKYYYSFEYRFRQQYYNVSEKGYDTNRLVADIVAHLTGEGKSRFDYHSSGNAESQPVIILFEDDYEVALEKAKGQVSSACSAYGSFDFEYRALTIAGRGQEQKKALLFNIYYK